MSKYLAGHIGALNRVIKTLYDKGDAEGLEQASDELQELAHGASVLKQTVLEERQKKQVESIEDAEKAINNALDEHTPREFGLWVMCFSPNSRWNAPHKSVLQHERDIPINKAITKLARMSTPNLVYYLGKPHNDPS